MTASGVRHEAASAAGPSGPPTGAAPASVAGRRLVFLVPAMVALLAGLDAALLLLDLPAPVSAERLPEIHGMLLVLGFVGTLISLERAVALRHRAGFAAPVLLGLGGLLLLSPAPIGLGRTCLLFGTLALTALHVPLWRRQRDDAVLVQALGAVLAAGAAAMWLGGVGVPVLLPWLVGFLVLTIAGERLELARIAMGPTAGPRLVVLAISVAAGLVTSLLWPTVGYPLLGLAVLVLGGWLAWHDVARRTIRSTGLTRFMAGCMLAGYCWLGVAGAVWTLSGAGYGGGAYDAVVHAVFLGFVMSMVMAHAPVILPAVLRRPFPYSPALLLPAGLLHGSLALRLWVGDALGVPLAWQTGGALNLAALLLFVGLGVWSATRAASSRPRRMPPAGGGAR